MNTIAPCAVLASLLLTGVVRGNVESGPAAGSDVSPFPVYAVEGEVSNEKLDIVQRRAGKPTLYVFVPAEKWSRPTARLLRKLDEGVADAADGATIVVVWLTSDANAGKAYLPQAQQALKLSHTTLAVYEETSTGPGEWGINSDAEATVVATRDGKTIKSFGIVSANETLADEILKTLKSP